MVQVAWDLSVGQMESIVTVYTPTSLLYSLLYSNTIHDFTIQFTIHDVWDKWGQFTIQFTLHDLSVGQMGNIVTVYTRTSFLYMRY